MAPAEIEECTAGSGIAQFPVVDVRTTPILKPTEPQPPSREPEKERRPPKQSRQLSFLEGDAREKYSKLRAKKTHSLVDCKYRKNLNTKFAQLHRTLQAAKSVVASNDESFQDFHKGGELASKVPKSVILTEAMNYLHQTELEMRHMTDEIQRLNSRVQSLEKQVLEKLVKCEDCSPHETNGYFG
jgi:hypothetical protein